MDASRNDKCDAGADERAGVQSTTINIQVALLGGQIISIETQLSATVSDIKAIIHYRLGHHAQPKFQKLILDTTILADSSALLKDVGVNDGSLLTLTFFNEPLGQDLLTEPDGKMKELNRRGKPNEVLNEFQLLSLQAAQKSAFSGLVDDYGSWGNLGAWDIDLYWTTRSNKCRYEYWSTAPGDNECGALIRIDVDSVTCIGEGSDDGLRVFTNFHSDVVANQLVREDWPFFKRQEEDEDGEETLAHTMAREREEKLEIEARKAIQAMRKLSFSEKKKAMKKLPLNVQAKVAQAMTDSSSSADGNSIVDTMVSGGQCSGGLFGAPQATIGESSFFGATGSSIFGAVSVSATTGSSLFGAGSSLFGTNPAATGSSLFGAVPATTGTSLFGAVPATTGSSLFGAGPVTTGSGLFGAVPATIGGGLFGPVPAVTGSALFDPVPAATGSSLFGSVPATTASGLFGAVPAVTGGGLFDPVPVTTGSSLFGAVPATTGSGLFGAVPATIGMATTGSSLFGAPLAATGSGHVGAALVATDPGSCASSSGETPPKQDQCKMQ